jgi:hypothetical protein
VSGKTAIDYAKSHPVAWESFEQMFANTTPDGQAFMVKGDIIKARLMSMISQPMVLQPDIRLK